MTFQAYRLIDDEDYRRERREEWEREDADEQTLGFVMTLAGYEATPAEEMDSVGIGAAIASGGDDG